MAEEPVKATGDSVWGDTQKKWAYLAGHVRIVQGKTIITTENAAIDLDKKLVFLKSRVKMAGSETTIEADNLEYNLKQKKGTFRGAVVLSRVEVKDNQGKVAKDPFQLKADELYFETDSNNFTAKGRGRVEHRDFSGTAEQIDYRDDIQELWFQIEASLKKNSGEIIQGDLVKIDLKAKSFKVTDHVNLQIQVSD